MASTRSDDAPRRTARKAKPSTKAREMAQRKVAVLMKGTEGRGLPKAGVAGPKAKAAKAKAAAPVPKKTAKRSAEESEEDEDESPKAKKAKIEKAAPKKKVAAPKVAVAKKVIPKKTAVKKDKPAPKAKPASKKESPAVVENGAESESEVEEKQSVVKKTATPQPEATPAVKTFTSQPGIKTQPKVPVHKIGKPINAIPDIKLDVYVFGEGSSGELGLGSKKDANGRNPIDVQRPRLNPNLLADKVGVVQIAVGGMHCAALTHDNKILTWGVNDQGALGRDTKWEGGLKEMKDADDEDSDDDDADMNPLESTPLAIDSKWFPEGTKFVQLVASDSATYALTEDGAVYGWGTFRSNDGILGFTETRLVQWYPTFIPDLKKIVTMAAGSNHVLAINNAGRAFAWGSGQQNQLGRRVIERTRLTGLVPREFGLRGKVAKVACGSYHSFAIDVKGKVYSWGLNSYGQTGIVNDVDAESSFLLSPTVVESLKDYEIVDINGGGHHSIACTKDGKALVWGRCDGGQLGIKLESLDADDVTKDEHGRIRILQTPTAIDAITGVTSVSAGNDNSFIITNKGQAWSCGFNANYQTGQGGDDDVMEAKALANTAVTDKQIVGGLAGGQFGVLIGKAK